MGLEFLAETGLLAEVLSYGNPSLIDHIEPLLAGAIAIVEHLPAPWHQRLAALGLSIFGDADGVHAMCRRLRLSRDDERRITRMSRSALAIIDAPAIEPEILRRWSVATDDPDAAIVLASVIGDDPRHVEQFAVALADLHEREGSDPPTILDGAQIMEVLDLAPGPAIGRAQGFLRDHYFAQGPLDTHQQLDLLRSWPG